MKERLRIFGWLAAYWISFFVVSRAIFLFYHFQQTTLLSLRDIGMIFLLGLRMDAAMTGYWLLLSGLLLTIPTSGSRLLFYSHFAITIFLLFVSVTIVMVDLELYSHWGFRMNTTPLFYISKEALGSVNPTSLIYLMIIFFGLFVGYWILYQRTIARKFADLPSMPIAKAPLMLLVTAALILPIRSSLSVAPLNSGVVYFHKTMAFPNHAGINATWNFFNSLVAQDEVTYPTNFYEGTDENEILHQLVAGSHPAPSLLNQNRPNILLIVMESFTAKIVGPLGGLKDITPQLNLLSRQGILFDNFYASGDRTDKGLVSVLSGYPAQPLTSIIKFPEKTGHLPFLSRSLEHLGYHTSFVYGGDIGFANMESYLTTGGFSHITEDDDFDESDGDSKWGVPDHIVFERLLTECDTAKGPFFKVMLSLSSHEPFDVPMKSVIKGNDERSMFLNACYYADQSLGAFVEQARKKSWWKNTIIVITADHGHHYPDNSEELKDKARFKIPFLWIGGALNKNDSVIHTLGGQTDIANTLLSQIDQPQSDFIFSKNILDRQANPFAVYIFHNGYGFVDPLGETIYDFDFKNFVKQEANPDNTKKGKAYMEVLFEDYNSR